ncbi:glutathione S-transferase family protein [Sphingosinithalassobacter portus]|uniref:glutathione S-transferase family protein n=1 Tax=Stakelama portus TaxID=2676234 RepID=UPI00137A5AEA|nr:glutathione S-transferase family protein [Sphingosinithalassobacter portus]
MLSLYRFRGATCASKVMLVLAEKGLDYEDRLVPRSYLSDPEYLKLNPAGVVPTLVHDGNVLVESSVIMTYLDEVFPRPALRPDTPLGRARVNAWLKRLDDSLQHLGIATYAIAMRHPILALPAEQREAYYASVQIPERRQLYRNLVEQGLEAPEVGGALQALKALQHEAERSLAADFLVGDYSLADAGLTPFLARMELLGLLLPEAETPRLHQWWQRVQDRPSFDVAVTAAAPENADQIRQLAAAAKDQIARLLAS